MQAIEMDEVAGETADATGPAGGAGRRRLVARRDESGLVFVWTTLFLLVLLGFAALAVDLGHSYFVGEREQNAVDAAALAGAPYLPADPAAAHDAALQLASVNGFTDGQDGVRVSAAPSPTDPSQLEVTISQDVPTWFGGAIGFHTMTVAKSGVGVASEASSATPVDMVLILDRTGSMSAQDLQNVKDASLALLGTLDTSVDHVALGVLGPSSTTTACSGNGNDGGFGLKGSGANTTWLAAPYPNGPLLNDYRNSDGTLNYGSQIVKTINCLNTSSVGTDLGDPVAAAQAYLAANGRPDAQHDIILMTDGSANQPNNTSCNYANNDATSAKNAGITIVTIGFGIGHAPCEDVSGPYARVAPSTVGANATKLLADMASPVAGVPAADDHDCSQQSGVDAENTDGDNFFCVPKGQDLTSVFVTAASQVTGATPRLIK